MEEKGGGSTKAEGVKWKKERHKDISYDVKNQYNRGKEKDKETT